MPPTIFKNKKIALERQEHNPTMLSMLNNITATEARNLSDKALLLYEADPSELRLAAVYGACQILTNIQNNR